MITSRYHFRHIRNPDIVQCNTTPVPRPCAYIPILGPLESRIVSPISIFSIQKLYRFVAHLVSFKECQGSSCFSFHIASAHITRVFHFAFTSIFYDDREVVSGDGCLLPHLWDPTPRFPGLMTVAAVPGFLPFSLQTYSSSRYELIIISSFCTFILSSTHA